MIKWNHHNPEYPVEIYNETSDDLWETRKVEVFSDGSLGYADSESSSKTTGLGIEPIPPLSEIAKNPEFELIEIAKTEFERIWERRGK